MKRSKLNEVLVGAFGLLGLFLLALLIFLMGGLDVLFEKSTVVHATFPDVQGVQPGDPVYLFGLRVGKVQTVELLPRTADSAARLRVSMKMPLELRSYLRVNSSVKIDKSLTGSLSVLIQESDGPPLPEEASLEGSEGIQLGEVAEQMKSVLGEGESLVAALKRMVEGVEEKGDLTAALADIRALLEETRAEIKPVLVAVRETLDAVHGILDENRLDVRHTLTNLKDVSGDARLFLRKLEDAPANIRESLTALREAASDIGDAVEENRTHIDSLLGDLSRTAQNAENLSAEIKRRPWRLLYQPSIEEQKELELYDAAWAYNLGASDLYQAVRMLAARLERDRADAADPEIFGDALAAVRESLARHRQAEEVFWKRLKAE